MSAVRRASGVLGEVLITAGVVVLLFVVYQLVWTNVWSDRVASGKIASLEQSWTDEAPSKPEAKALKNGEAFAILRIPRLGANYRVPIVQGVSLDRSRHRRRPLSRDGDAR